MRKIYNINEIKHKHMCSNVTLWREREGGSSLFEKERMKEGGKKRKEDRERK